jgi:CRISPR system Cascade subunit CasD
MNVLLLRLSGPMQSWGVQSRFTVRDTGREPSKSGVVGLLCAALGRPREEPVDDLARLKMGVRADQEGSVAYDYQTAMDIYRAGGRGTKPTETSKRYYLSDARFLVGLAGTDLDLLKRLYDAVRDPHWLLFLGRKAFVPGEPVWLEDGLRPDVELLEELKRYPWLGPKWRQPAERLRLILEDPDGPQVRSDQPVSFAERRYAPRHVRTTFIDAPPEGKEVVDRCTSPD